MARTVLSDEEKMCIKALALDIADLRKQINQLAEALAKMNDKQFREAFSQEDKIDVSEKQVDNYELALQKKMDAAESDLR